MLKFETKISISNIITIGIYPLCFTFVPLVFLQKKKTLTKPNNNRPNRNLQMNIHYNVFGAPTSELTLTESH